MAVGRASIELIMTSFPRNRIIKPVCMVARQKHFAIFISLIGGLLRGAGLVCPSWSRGAGLVCPLR